MQHLPDALLPGRPFPLGATWDGLGINFAVFSAHAQRIDLCLFEPSGRHEIARYTLPEYTDEVWHGYLPDATAGLLYGYRAYGPYAPEHGHRFNHHKLLLDPYARGLAGSVHWSDALYGFRQHSLRGDLSFDRRDSAPAMPKGVVTDDSFNWGDDRPPAVPWSDTVIYEAHVRGLTMLHDGVRPSERGTFAGLGASRGDRSPAPARHHRDRTDAGACLPAGPRRAAARPAQLLGLQHARLLRAGTVVSVGRLARTRCASRCAGCTPPASR